MPQLITNSVLRRLAQVVLIVTVVLMLLICIGFALFTAIAKFGVLGDLQEPALFFFGALSLPFQSIFAPAAVLATAVPILVASVCYQIDAAADPPNTTDRLNRVGGAAAILMVGGLVIGIVAMLLSAAAPATIDDLADGPAKGAAVRTVITAIVSFQAMYLAQFFGLRPK